MLKNPDVLRWFIRDFVDLRMRTTVSSLLFFVSVAARPFRRDFSYSTLMTAHRIANNRVKIIHRTVLALKTALVQFSLSQSNSGAAEDDLARAIRRTIVLKRPKTREGLIVEKGILLIKFTDSFMRLFGRFDFNAISKDYHVILEPSWAGYCLPEILIWLSLKEPIIVQASEAADFEFLKDLQSNIYPIEIGSGNWVDDRYFKNINSSNKKLYDAVYVANYNGIKRHHVLFRAVSKIAKRRNIRVALVCGTVGGQGRTISKLMDYYGVRNNIELFENLPKSELNEILNKSKTNMLLSLKEGSNRSIFEGFFSGTPAILLKNNIGVNKKYINARTGLLVEESDFPNALETMVRDYRNFDPARWATENITPEESTAQLLALIRKIEGNPKWGQDCEIAVKVNNPEATYKVPLSGDQPTGSTVLEQYRY